MAEVFSKEAVITAIRCTARGIAGLMKRDEAEKTIESLPEDLAEIVMGESTKACKEQAAVKAKSMAQALSMLAEKIAEGPEE